MLENKVMIILGATGGIGSEVAKKASKLGAKLVLVARTSTDLKELESKLEHAISIQADVTNPDDLKSVVERVLRTSVKLMS